MSRYDRLCAYVGELENNLARVREVIGGLADARRHTPIPGGYGTVTVSGSGKLVAVDVAKSTPRYVNGKGLAKALVEAIGTAEREAKLARQRQLNELVGSNSPIATPAEIFGDR